MPSSFLKKRAGKKTPTETKTNPSSEEKKETKTTSTTEEDFLNQIASAEPEEKKETKTTSTTEEDLLEQILLTEPEEDTGTSEEWSKIILSFNKFTPVKNPSIKKPKIVDMTEEEIKKASKKEITDLLSSALKFYRQYAEKKSGIELFPRLGFPYKLGTSSKRLHNEREQIANDYAEVFGNLYRWARKISSLRQCSFRPARDTWTLLNRSGILEESVNSEVNKERGNLSKEEIFLEGGRNEKTLKKLNKIEELDPKKERQVALVSMTATLLGRANTNDGTKDPCMESEIPEGLKGKKIVVFSSWLSRQPRKDIKKSILTIGGDETIQPIYPGSEFFTKKGFPSNVKSTEDIIRQYVLGYSLKPRKRKGGYAGGIISKPYDRAEEIAGELLNKYKEMYPNGPYKARYYFLSEATVKREVKTGNKVPLKGVLTAKGKQKYVEETEEIIEKYVPVEVKIMYYYNADNFLLLGSSTVVSGFEVAKQQRKDGSEYSYLKPVFRDVEELGKRLKSDMKKRVLIYAKRAKQLLKKSQSQSFSYNNIIKMKEDPMVMSYFAYAFEKQLLESYDIVVSDVFIPDKNLPVFDKEENKWRYYSISLVDFEGLFKSMNM